MDKIQIENLEVFYRVGVPDEERRNAQRLLLSVEIHHDFAKAAQSDDLEQTVNYFAVCQRLLGLGQGREWKLLETLAVDIANLLIDEFGVGRVEVKIKKFIIAEAEYVGVEIVREKKS
ncbi:MAG: folB [Verrucomicrobiales bacterium]|nr:folB [Verrucomicrobiales bacterium]